VDVTLKQSLPVRMVNVFQRNTNVMVKPNAKMALMMVTINVASRNSHSTMTEDVVAAKISGSVRVVTVFPSKDSVTVLPNAEMALMKKRVRHRSPPLNVALRISKLIPTRTVAAIQRLNHLVINITSSVISNPNAVTV
jgi:hypothetical protein